MSINKETFRTFVEQILTTKMSEFTLSSNAVTYLHTHIEEYLEEIVSAAEECRSHAGRTVLRAEDIRLTLTLKKRLLPFCLKV